MKKGDKFKFKKIPFWTKEKGVPFFFDEEIEIYDYGTNEEFSEKYGIGLLAGGDMRIAYQIWEENPYTYGYHLGFCFPADVISLNNEVDKCVCSSWEIWNYGCICNFLKKQRELGLE